MTMLFLLNVKPNLATGVLRDNHSQFHALIWASPVTPATELTQSFGDPKILKMCVSQLVLLRQELNKVQIKAKESRYM